MENKMNQEVIFDELRKTAPKGITVNNDQCTEYDGIKYFRIEDPDGLCLFYLGFDGSDLVVVSFSYGSFIENAVQRIVSRRCTAPQWQRIFEAAESTVAAEEIYNSRVWSLSNNRLGKISEAKSVFDEKDCIVQNLTNNKYSQPLISVAVKLLNNEIGRIAAEEIKGMNKTEAIPISDDLSFRDYALKLDAVSNPVPVNEKELTARALLQIKSYLLGDLLG